MFPALGAFVALYGLFGLLCGLASSFELLIGARLAMGASAAVTRVLVVAMVRDLFEGEAMARVMSLVFMIFMIVPVIAPSVGQLILLVGSWRLIFGVLASYALVMGLWSGLRLPETLHPEFRRALHPGDIASAVKATLVERQSLGYTIALTAVYGGLTAYIASIQQIVFDAFHTPKALPLVFAAIAAPMALASWSNARIVGRFGLRPVGHAGLIGYVLLTVAHAALSFVIAEPLWLFVLAQGLVMMSFAFTTSNLSTLAMEHMAAIAGTASSVQGVIGTIGGAAVGFLIGQHFDGTTWPFLSGLAMCGIVAMLALLVTERGKLMDDPR